VRLAGHLAQERLQQRRDEIRCVGEGVGHLTGGGKVGQQGHGQRVPAAEHHQMRPDGRRHIGVGEQLTAFGRVETLEAMHRHKLPPAGVGAPRRGGRVAAGQHDDGVGAQAGDKVVAQPPVDRGELLVAVNEQHGAGQQPRHRFAVGLLVEGEPDGRFEALR
jgi:hypothetical protein